MIETQDRGAAIAAAIAGTRVSTMERPHYGLPCFHAPNTCKRYTGRLASLFPRHSGPYLPTMRRSSHVYKIDLWESSGSESERVSTAMQPEMVTHLQLGAYDAWISFSGGSVAGTRCDISCWNAFYFRDYRNCFCAELQLYGIPPSGYLFFFTRGDGHLFLHVD